MPGRQPRQGNWLRRPFFTGEAQIGRQATHDDGVSHLWPCVRMGTPFGILHRGLLKRLRSAVRRDARHLGDISLPPRSRRAASLAARSRR
eukprot:scaffold73150_cov57-Phaeocystis_antarctica.AAC.2